MGEPTRSLGASHSGSPGSAIEMAPVLGSTIGQYQVRRLLGAGGMGQVYLARHIVLGRSVALKIVAKSARTEYFLDEACAVAMLNHPNIVQLYEYGEFRDGVYLALEYVDGETLRARMSQGLLATQEALRHARAIADALAHAHRAGIYHCDLKPSNVMVGRDGRVRVVDFGIARTRGDTAGTMSGTPAWMAPEQWNGAPLTDRVDIWALGVVTAQLLTGAHPLGDDAAQRRTAALAPDRVASFECDRHLIPAPIIELITRSLERTPEQRPSAAEWSRVLDNVISGRGDAITEDGPYPGLAAFDEQRTRFYFGREREIDEFLERLRDVPCLPIVGPSGAGKSSFLHAGLIPRLRARERWTVIAFRPGPDPVGALARHVIAALSDNTATSDLQMKDHARSLRDELVEMPTRLAAMLATVAADRDSRVLLAVDQLEEIFTQGSSSVKPSDFLQILLSAADDPLDPVRVVFTVRDDFVGKIAGLRSLFVMQKLGTEDLRRTITAPLARCHYEFDDLAMIDDLLSEVGCTDVADLPLLQFACHTLWRGRDVSARRLRRATYEEMGGLAGALAQHAERALAELSPAERGTARRLLLQLVSGTTRRSVRREQLISAIGGDANAVLDRLLVARLLVQRTPYDGEATFVEIAHESLLTTWSQLARWVDESRDERRLLSELDEATALWERRGRRAEDTWLQDDLVAVRHRAARLGVALPVRTEVFLAAGEQRHRSQLRRRRIRVGMTLAAACAVGIPAFILIGRYLAREQLISSNTGTIEIVLAPFDWVNGAPHAAPLVELPMLAWRLHTAQPASPHEPGEVLPAKLVDVVDRSSTGSTRRWLVRAPGGMAFLEIDGRGRIGEHCEPSWVRIQAFPGYSTSANVEILSIDVPTCQATRAGMLPVEAGPFIYGGPGEPPFERFGERDYDTPQSEVDLPAFELDRTEVSNAQFAPFAKLERITGYPAPLYVNDVVHEHDGDPSQPLTDIDLFEAQAFCRYMGKTLPTDEQWMKASRGGRMIGGEPNPSPARRFPWGSASSPLCVNSAGTDDGNAWTAPVDSYGCGAGPYGHVNLVGNVDEWISPGSPRLPISTKGSQVMIRGGSAESPPELLHASTIFVNHRNPLQFDYAIGLRCSTHN